MNSFYLGDRRTGLGNTGIRMLQAAALALILAMVLPARAADERVVKTRVAPVYPEIAKRMRISGAVKMEATVDADGSVKDVKTVSGNHMLAVAAEDAVRHWKFVTGSGNSIVNLEVNFASVP
jgi:TonB family protein